MTPRPPCQNVGIAGIETEWRQKLGVMLGAARGEHREIAFGKAIRRVFVHSVERIHQAIAERISVDVERRMDEVRDVGPERLIAGLELDRGTEAFALH